MKAEIKIKGNSSHFNKEIKRVENRYEQAAEKLSKGIDIGVRFSQGGSFTEAAGGIAELASATGRLAGPQGVALAAAGAVMTLINSTTAMSKELRTASEASGLSIENLQKMTGVVKSLGLSASEMADVHNDVNEKVYEAVQSGTGEFATVVKEYKVKFSEISKVMENGGDGLDALAKLYYSLRQQGKTHQEAASALSRVTDKGSELANQFNKMGSEAEYYKQKGDQVVNITSDMAEQHKKYEEESAKLRDAINGIKLETLSNAIPLLTSVFTETLNFIKKAREGKGIPGMTMDAVKSGWSLNPVTAVLDAYHKNKATLSPYADANRKLITDEQWNKMTKEQKAHLFTTGQSYFDMVKGKSKEQIEAIDYALKSKYAGTSDDSIPLAIGESIVSAIRDKADWGGLVPVDNGKNLGSYRYKASDGMTYDGFGTGVIDFNGNGNGGGKAGRELNDGGGTKCSKCGKKAHEGNEKCPVDLAKAATKLAQDEQKKRAEIVKRYNSLNVRLNSALANSITSQNAQLHDSLKIVDDALKTGAISQEEAAERRQQLIDANTENVHKMVLGADPVEALNALNQLNEIRDTELENHRRLLESKAISYDEYMRRVNDTEQSYSQIADSTNGLADHKSNELTNSFAYESSNSPFAQFNEIDREKANLEQEYQNQKLEIGKIKDPAEQFKQMEALNESHQKKMRDIDKKYAYARQKVADDMYAGFAGAMSLFGAENSKAMKAAFAAHQAFSIGQATVNMWTAATDAWNDPENVTTSQKIAASALAVAQNMGNIAKIKSTSIDGMAHDGIDNIPREGTWLLQKGERVVDDRTNGDLKDFLNGQKSGNGSASPIEVNAPLTIQGNVNSADKMVMDAIKRHAQFVAQAVEDAQRRKM